MSGTPNLVWHFQLELMQVSSEELETNCCKATPNLSYAISSQFIWKKNKQIEKLLCVNSITTKKQRISFVTKEFLVEH